MSKVFIIGAAGQIGRRLVSQLAEQGHRPVGLHRHSEQGEQLKSLGADTVQGDLTALSVTDFAGLMRGCDCVVFTAGAGGKGGMETTNAIDGKGLELAVAAATRAGVARFLLVSAFPEAGRGKAGSDTFENYMAVKKQADVHLAASDLDWVILRPGTLVDDAGNGNVTAGLAIPYGNISRDNVAAALATLVGQPQVTHKIIELTDGSTPVAQAIGQFAGRA
ncbi:SDR family oxidoreductase [Erwinia persicina]|uniref:NAD-dependent dehydratase n=1 Tax=Erwinia persicina TaxID=55211 RepID=A0A4U3FLX4_9GAMM|nr:SDR family oxidoreductase [Erwinia persicina]MBD8105120.1 SDR family oxidoreductase [Erwinia persicina]MBD8208266.1 SDR family oxidoreductase [Erwinia persicina]TKJ95173.1 NAD-dependent dehydratase [Erwinia persicina]